MSSHYFFIASFEKGPATNLDTKYKEENNLFYILCCFIVERFDSITARCVEKVEAFKIRSFKPSLNIKEEHYSLL